MAKEINIKALNAYKEILKILNKTHLDNDTVTDLLFDVRSNYWYNHHLNGSDK